MGGARWCQLLRPGRQHPTPLCHVCHAPIPADTTLPPLVRLSGAPWPPVIETNMFDLLWEYSLALADVVTKIHGAARLPPGAELTEAPCYNGDPFAVAGYHGSDAAFGMVRS